LSVKQWGIDSVSTLDQSFARLRLGSWTTNAQLASMNDSSCAFQKLSEGSGSYVYDEYSVIISAMPATLTAEDYWLEFAKSPNKAVDNGLFSAMNVFTKRTSSSPKIGDLYDIDILGPDNGSIVLVALSPGFGMLSGDGWFDIQTVSCAKYGSHPENGAREFGFEYVSDGVKFYTRGISRPGNAVIRLAGAAPQMMGWTGMMKGISETLRRRGGTPKENSFKMVKFTKN
jgi:hypothetical protein